MLVTGMTVEIFQFVWIKLEVIEFPLVDILLVKMNQLESAVRDAIMSTHIMPAWIFVVVIVKGLAPVSGGFSAQDGLLGRLPWETIPDR